MKITLSLLVVFSLLSLSALLAEGNGAPSKDSIETIRAHYNTINRNLPRYRKVEKELSGYSAEGGSLAAYYDGNSIRKISALYYGETGKASEDYYYWDNQLIFVYRKDFQYDKPASGRVVATADENRIDLICIGAHGGSRGMQTLLGTNVERVLKRATCPVLVTRPMRVSS